ncbi:MAG: SRPBCC domain-containing protein [Bacteroidota bacterium]|nr:SRPBCC domain-containing protein [Ferruginibacter sp.]
MEKKEFKININAPREKVWDILWDDATYTAWTEPFCVGSRAETDWKEGSKVLFTDGKGSGMVSRIAEMKPNEYMSFEHLGTLKDGVEDTTSEENKAWAGALENYYLRTENGGTALTVEMSLGGIPPEMLAYFSEAWPKALDKVKEISEKN